MITVTELISEKILVPHGAKRSAVQNEYSKTFHITAIVTLNAAGNQFPLYFIVPLNYLPRDLVTLALWDRIVIDASTNGYMDDDNLEGKWVLKYTSIFS